MSCTINRNIVFVNVCVMQPLTAPLSVLHFRIQLFILNESGLFEKQINSLTLNHVPVLHHSVCMAYKCWELTYTDLSNQFVTNVRYNPTM